MATYFSLKFEDLIIREVRKYGCLYDTEDQSFKDTRKRDRIWRAISDVAKQDVNTCKKAWKNLRDGYRRHRRKQIAGTYEARTVRPFRLQQEMDFILPYLTEGNKRTLSNPHDDSDDEFQGIYNNDTEDTQNVDINAYHRDINTMAVADDTSTGRFPVVAHASRSPPPIWTPPSKARRMQRPTETSELQELLEEANGSKSAKRDPVDSFFYSISDTVKRLPPVIQCQIKMQVAKVVGEAEMRYLTHPQASTQTLAPNYAAASQVSMAPDISQSSTSPRRNSPPVTQVQSSVVDLFDIT